jgi:type I restriction enzyme, S subunit
LQKAKPGYKLVKSLFGKYEEIPEDWEVNTLDSITILLTNGFVGKATEHYTESSDGVLYVQGYNVKKNGFNFHGIKHVTKQFHDEHSKSQLELGDLLTIQTGDIGTTTIVPPKLVGTNCHALIISRFHKEIAHSNYYNQYFNSEHCKKLFNSIETGTTMKHLNGGHMKKLRVMCPPLEQQQKIASILSNVDELISSYDKTIQTTKKLKTGLMQTLLTRGIGHKKFKKVKWLFGKEIEIPEEWEVLPLSKICKIRETDSVKSNLYIGLEHINQNNNKLVGQSTTEEFTSNTNSFHNNDILYGKLRPLLNKVWLATEEGHCSTDILPLQTKDNVVPTILLLVLTDYRFFWFAVSTSSGTKMPRTNWSNMKNFLVFLPSIPEQQKITSILSSVDNEITKLELKKKSAESLKKGLMQKLLTGQIRVKA